MTDTTFFTASATSGKGVAARATAHLPGNGTEPGAFLVMAHIDQELTDALLPRGDRVQFLGLRILIDEQTLDPRWLLEDIEVQQRTEGFAAFTFTVVIERDGERWPLGSPWALRSPPPGRGAITIQGFYGTTGGLKIYPLVTNGLANEAELDTIDGVDVLLIQGLGPGAHHQRRLVSLQLAPDHRTPRGMVVRRLAQLAGVTSISIPAGKGMKKEFTIREFKDNLLHREVISTKGWYLQRWPLKQRPTGGGFVSWEEEPFISPSYTLGNGESIGPSALGERYSPGNVGSPVEQDSIGFGQYVERRTIDYELDGLYVVAETTTTEAPHVPPGTSHLYQGDETGGSAFQQFGPVERVAVTNSALGEASSLKITTTIDLLATGTGRVSSRESEEIGSYLPEAERLVDGTDPSFPRLGEARPLEATCRADLLEATHPRYEVDGRSDWAETVAELESLCLQRLREGVLIEAEFVMPACFGIRKGAVLHGVLPRIDLQHNMLVREVITRGGPDGVTTTLKGVVRAL